VIPTLRVNLVTLHAQGILASAQESPPCSSHKRSLSLHKKGRLVRKQEMPVIAQEAP
jgi:hypothetical protein